MKNANFAPCYSSSWLVLELGLALDHTMHLTVTVTVTVTLELLPELQLSLLIHDALKLMELYQLLELELRVIESLTRKTMRKSTLTPTLALIHFLVGVEIPLKMFSICDL